jgi:hypothetical protein
MLSRLLAGSLLAVAHANTAALYQGSRPVVVAPGQGIAPGTYIVVDTPVRDSLSFHYVATAMPWESALTACPIIDSRYTGLAHFYDAYEWDVRRHSTQTHDTQGQRPLTRPEQCCTTLLWPTPPRLLTPLWVLVGYSCSRKRSIAASASQPTAASRARTSATPTPRTSRAYGLACPRPHRCAAAAAHTCKHSTPLTHDAAQPAARATTRAHALACVRPALT